MPYEMRTPTREEIPPLIDLLNLVFRPDGGNMGEEFPSLVREENLEQLRVIVEDGRIVAHVGMTLQDAILGGIPTRICNIGAVSTHPDTRGKGYATLLMEDAVQHARSGGADIMLISGGRGLYRRMNAVDCGLFPFLTLTERDAESEFLEARQVKEADLPQIAAVRQRESTRYLLSLEELRVLYSGGFAMCRPVEWWLFSEGGIPCAFGVISKEIRDGETCLQLIEWNGDAEALRSAWATWSRTHQVNRIDIVTTSPMNLPASWRSRIEKRITFSGTALVLHARRFLERARPMLTERSDLFSSMKIEAGETALRFCLEDDCLRLNNGGEIAELFFGVPDRDLVAERTRSGSALAEALQQIFPIPLVWYGIAYI
ncbi:MAG TPA: GNAT family N-acetyltransferase [bacterium]|nr:GNAT family N-acetyltransferase [bacterium]HPO07803.1 GNAT family N-acetyltransferase [bacterium]HQP99453.1 GNAT family N-acetyltransferase [bacterium]